MTMIGPAAPNQPCPECDGEGIEHYRSDMYYRPGVLFPELGEWIEISTPVECDFCGGSGKVTKATVKALKQQTPGGAQ